jgi:hypothetical protein
MALKEMARIALRFRRAPWIAAAALALSAIAGCNCSRRETLRPIYAAPAAAAPACTNCGSGSGVIVNPPNGSSTRVLPSDSSVEEASGPTESTVPPLNAPAGSSRLSSPSNVPEPAPKATIGEEPGLDMAPSQSVKPSSPGSPSSGSPSGKAPALDAPGGAPKATLYSTDGRQTTSASGKVRRVSAQERLRPFLDESESNELFYPNKADRPWQYIVLHHSANPEGSYDQIDGEHRKILGYDGCGYHFVIGNGTGSSDGRIEVAQRWVNQKHGVHCRNAKNAAIDEYGIGICLVGDLDKKPPTPKQIAAARALVAYLSARYGIARGRVETHAHLAATPTVCPGRFFPSQSLVAASTREARIAAREPVSASRRIDRPASSARY